MTFASPGDKLVTLLACNTFGCTLSQQTIAVLDPAPVIVSASVLVPVAEVGQLVPFQATATGRPALVYSWSVRLDGDEVATLSGAAPYWNTADRVPGSYEVVLHLSNTAGAVQSAPIPVTLSANAATQFFTITPCRVVDTRTAGGPLTPGVPRLLPGLDVACGVPRFARAIAANVTAVAATGVGTINVYPGNYPLPMVSGQVGFAGSSTRAAMAVLPVSTDGVASLRAVAALPAGESVHLILDVSGYFAPPQ